MEILTSEITFGEAQVAIRSGFIYIDVFNSHSHNTSWGRTNHYLHKGKTKHIVKHLCGGSLLGGNLEVLKQGVKLALTQSIYPLKHTLCHIHVEKFKSTFPMEKMWELCLTY